jgi:hypothetical protein
VSINGEKVADISTVVTAEMAGKVLKVGKKEFRKVVIG